MFIIKDRNISVFCDKFHTFGSDLSKIAMKSSLQMKKNIL